MSNYDTNEWITPDWLIGRIEETVNDQALAGVGVRYNMNFDLAATSENTKCAKFWPKEDDTLGQDWIRLKKLVGKKAAGVFPWLNPPYGRRPGMDKFIAKIAESLSCFDLLVVLANQDSSTAWFNRLYSMSCEIWRLARRLKFEHLDPSAPADQAQRAQELFFIPRDGCSDAPLTRLWNPRNGEFL